MVDRVYDYSPRQCSSDLDQGVARGSERRSPVSRGYRRMSALYRAARRLEERGYVVDYARLFSVGFKRSLKRESSVK